MYLKSFSVLDVATLHISSNALFFYILYAVDKPRNKERYHSPQPSAPGVAICCHCHLSPPPLSSENRCQIEQLSRITFPQTLTNPANFVMPCLRRPHNVEQGNLQQINSASHPGKHRSRTTAGNDSRKHNYLTVATHPTQHTPPTDLLSYVPIPRVSLTRPAVDVDVDVDRYTSTKNTSKKLVVVNQRPKTNTAATCSFAPDLTDGFSK